MFALDKLLEVTRRAGKSYDLQTLAHFGIKTDTFDSDRVFYLGSHESPIIVRDINATADGSYEGNGSLVGDVSGKGYGAKSSDKPIKFTAKKHGVLMAIYSCVPKVDYTQLGYDRLQTLMERTDFPIMEFQNLGMQPLFGYQANISGSVTPQGNVSKSTQINSESDIQPWSNFDVWQYRYAEFKQKYNRVFGSLQFSERNWKTQNTLYAEYLDTNLYNMLISPRFLNGIVVSNYYEQPIPISFTAGAGEEIDTAISNLYSGDPLHHDFVFDVIKTSKLDNYGLPSL